MSSGGEGGGEEAEARNNGKPTIEFSSFSSKRRGK